MKTPVSARQYAELPGIGLGALFRQQKARSVEDASERFGAIVLLMTQHFKLAGISLRLMKR